MSYVLLYLGSLIILGSLVSKIVTLILLVVLKCPCGTMYYTPQY